MLLTLSLLILFFVTMVFVHSFSRYAISSGMVDIPNKRSSHALPKPRGGGIVFVVMWALAVLSFWKMQWLQIEGLLYFLTAAVILALLGFGDDRYNLPASVRLLVQFVIALFTVLQLSTIGIITFPYFGLELPNFLLGIVVIAIMWSANLYNFMDGIDGLAAVEAIFIFLFGGIMLYDAGAFYLAMLSWTLVATVAGFLIWNWPNSTIFMGDAGSIFLGYMAVMLALLANVSFNVPFIPWVILYGIFWFDATVTLIRRILLKQKWYAAHQNHAFQRLHLAGWSHSKILFGVIGVNCSLALLALMSYHQPRLAHAALMVAIALLTTIYIAIEKKQPLLKN